MGRINKCIKFDRKFLNGLKEDEHACVEGVKSVQHLAIHPFHLPNVNNSIKDVLYERVAKYDKRLNGILLGFQNVKLLRNIGSLNFDSCFTHLDVEAEFFVFKPEVGKVLNGTVSKKSKDHVGCLVHQIFNVSLPRPENCENWMGSKAQVGQEIQFQITFTNLEARLPYIKADFVSILSEDSGISTSEEGNGKTALNTITRFESDSDNHMEDEPTSERGKQRKRKFSESFSEPVNDVPDEEEEYVHRKHKKLKNKHAESEAVYDTFRDLTPAESETAKTKKKKKKKREVSLDEWESAGYVTVKEEVTLDEQEGAGYVTVKEEVTLDKREGAGYVTVKEEVTDEYVKKSKRKSVELKTLAEYQKQKTIDFGSEENYSDVDTLSKKKLGKSKHKKDNIHQELSSVEASDKKSKNKSKKVNHLSNSNISEKDFDEIFFKSSVQALNAANSSLLRDSFVEDVVADDDVSKSTKKKKARRKDADTSVSEFNLVERKKSTGKHKRKRKSFDIDATLSDLNLDELFNESLGEAKSKSNKRNEEKHSKEKKSERKSKDCDADITLPELNLDDILNDSAFRSRSSTDLTKRRSSRAHSVVWENKTLELPSDSDLENILAGCFKESGGKKHKAERRSSKSKEDEDVLATTRKSPAKRSKKDVRDANG